MEKFEFEKNINVFPGGFVSMGQTSEILIIITIGAPPNAAKDNAADIRVEVGAPLSRGRRQTPGLNKRCSPNDSYASPAESSIIFEPLFRG